MPRPRQLWQLTPSSTLSGFPAVGGWPCRAGWVPAGCWHTAVAANPGRGHLLGVPEKNLTAPAVSSSPAFCLFLLRQCARKLAVTSTAIPAAQKKKRPEMMAWIHSHSCLSDKQGGRRGCQNAGRAATPQMALPPLGGNRPAERDCFGMNQEAQGQGPFLGQRQNWVKGYDS